MERRLAADSHQTTRLVTVDTTGVTLWTGITWLQRRVTDLDLFSALVLVCAVATARTLWRAYQGRSLLWWHACTFGVGIVFLGLIGIVGD